MERPIRIAIMCVFGEERSRQMHAQAEIAAKELGMSHRFDIWHGGVSKENNGKFPFHKVVGMEQVTPGIEKPLTEFDCLFPAAGEVEEYLHTHPNLVPKEVRLMSALPKTAKNNPETFKRILAELASK